MALRDAHLHFFSKGVVAFYARQVDTFKSTSDPALAAALELKIEPPSAEPESLAGRWITELDRHGVAQATLFGSAPGEQGAIARAVKAFPGRFIPFQMVNARSADLPNVLRDLAEKKIRGVMLFPAMHGYFPDDPVCRPVYEAARENRQAVFVHLGKLRVAIQEKLGIKTEIDETLGDPVRLGLVAREFADVPFLVPHFGCGTLGELLPAIRGLQNVHLDTSSSNAWMADTPAYPTLEAVFQAVLASPDLGPQRILFGSDSTVFPRGFRADVRDAQMAALEAIGAPEADREAIFGGNFERLFRTVAPD
jgi:predicted TIM-barrel fold metal-dependent hydrolase